MRIINLVENTEGASGCGFEHGLSFYIETEHHKLLADTGASDLLLKNAEKLGIDLTKVDTVILSHGHYDHGGGILPFAEVNPAAKIYIPATAFGAYYSLRDGAPRYIGLAEEIRKLPQVVIVGETTGGICRVDDELSLFSGIGSTYPVPSANRNLRIKTKKGLRQDDFRHEQCLVICEGGRKVLLSGCAHHGILNVLDRYRELYGGEPDAAISGFHMMKKSGYSDEDINMIINTALELKKYRTVFYTGHCTGVEPYNAMKKLMDDQLRYVHSGDEIMLPADGSLRENQQPTKMKKEPGTAVKTEAEAKSAAEAPAKTEPEPAEKTEPEPAEKTEPETAATTQPETPVKTAAIAPAKREPESAVKTETEAKSAPKAAAGSTHKKSRKLLAGAATVLLAAAVVTGRKRR